MQIRVPEDLKFLGVLERTFTVIKVREAGLNLSELGVIVGFDRVAYVECICELYLWRSSAGMN